MTLNFKGNLVQPNLPDEVPIDWIMEKVRVQMSKPPTENPFGNRLMLLDAKTGTGKSMTLPGALYVVFDRLGILKKILCTQPKVLTTVTTAEQTESKDLLVPKFNQKFILGENLSYQTSSARSERAPRGLRIVTLGTLTSELISSFSQNQARRKDPCKEYNAIIIDEAHERSAEFDTAMIYLKKFYNDRKLDPDLPFLVLMSATFDIDKYAEFFKVTQDNIVKVGGRSFPIETRFLSFTAIDWQREAYNVALQCIKENITQYLANQPPTDIKSIDRILIFVPGSGEAVTIKKHFKSYSEGTIQIVNGKRVYIKLDVAFIDSNAQRKKNSDYLLIFGEDEPKYDYKYTNQVILSTSVAETGLTLPDLTFVIDSMWSRSTEFDPNHNISPFLTSKPTELSRAIQRRGRCGRTKPGIYYPLCTEETFNKLQKMQYPDIFKNDAAYILLLIIQVFDGIPENLSDYLLDTPPKASVTQALTKLQLIGAIDQDYKLTTVGQIAAEAERLRPETVVACLHGTYWGCPPDDILAAIMMAEAANSSDNPYGDGESQRKIPNLKQWEEIFFSCFNTKMPDCYYRFRLQTADDPLLHLVTLRAFENKFQAWKDKIDVERRLKDWCESCFISYNKMVETFARYEEERNKLVRSGVDMHYMYDQRLPYRQDWTEYATSFKMSLYGGFKLNTATFTDKYYIDWGQMPVNWSFFDDSVGGWDRFEASRDYQPKRIMALTFGLKNNRNTNMFGARALGVSVLSGFI